MQNYTTQTPRLFNPEHDGDGVPDSVDLDSDNDGFLPILVGGEAIDLNNVPDTDSDNIPDILELPELPEIGSAEADGQVHTGFAGRGCSILPTDRKGPLDPMLAMLALTAAIGTRWSRKLRVMR